MKLTLHELLQKNKKTFHSIVKWNPLTDHLYHFDFTLNNRELCKIDLTDMNQFCNYVNERLLITQCKWGIGGYNENRILYKRSHLFDGTSEPRTIHLGIDIWGNEGTEVFAPLDGVIHSFAFNNHFGDYGATIILKHNLGGTIFHTLYGHLSLQDINHLQVGAAFQKGQLLAHFGRPEENGHWPPHLHFQIIEDMQGKKGDYPGVCTITERESFLENSPDPDSVLGMMQYAKKQY